MTTFYKFRRTCNNIYKWIFRNYSITIINLCVHKLFCSKYWGNQFTNVIFNILNN